MKHTRQILDDSTRTSLKTAIQKLILCAEGEQKELKKTPDRVVNSYSELLSGYQENLETVVNGAIFSSEIAEEVIICKNINFSSLCEHHLLPFWGKADVIYLCNKKIIGISKIPRVINMYARRLQLQERLTNEIADALFRVIEPISLIVILEAVHSCAVIRGSNQPGLKLKTVIKKGDPSKLSFQHGSQF